MINWLKDQYNVTVVGAIHAEIDGVNSFTLVESKEGIVYEKNIDFM